MPTRWHVARDEADWLTRALDFIARAETETLAVRDQFHIVLAGGGTPLKLYRALAGEAHEWSRWRVWYGDERCLPVDDPERNSKAAMDAWLARVPIPAAHIHPIPAERGALTAAEAYARRLADRPDFDLVLLGLGEDGHTASLFPDHDWGVGPDAPAALAVFGAPKPPPERVSLSARRLGQAGRVLFLVTGAGKQQAVAAWRRNGGIPAAAIRPAAGVDVLLDEAANGGRI